ncbi:hypothetical protein MD588_14165 [Photobacterium sp. SDRW27]|uniref:hypothetical protein n=1 Tax=Photobacterium obscurum TaxID=2829490 RepID=UPI002243A0D7|nr:hypothetical protein [Photobacterium obscurum]MCW8329950.1 hypothetical protein [Photobacterium obscurum]
MLNKLWYLFLSLIFVSAAANGSEVTDASYPGKDGNVMRNKLVGIYTTFQLTETVITGCNRLESSISTDVKIAFDGYSEVARDYILEGKRLLDEELSAVEVIEWRTALANAQQQYQRKFDQLSLAELKQECQQLAREMATINQRVIALKSQ